MTIKMTKELPTEVGYYYMSYGLESAEFAPDIVEISIDSGSLIVDSAAYQYKRVSYYHGYFWAKVDKDQFEFVD